jgi:hypothetical protein
MISFTLSHKREDSLRDTLNVLSEAWRDMTQCKCFAEYRKAKTTKGHVRSLEVTWGKANGWHPHYHALFFMPDTNRIAGFYSDIRTMWFEAVERAGGSSTWERGCNLTVCDNSIAAYVAKWGHDPANETLPQLTRWGKAQEMTRGPMKEAEKDRYTPFEMLEEYLISRDLYPAYWGALYKGYAIAMRGQRQLTWSRKPDLREVAGLKDEKGEQEIIEGEEAGYILLAQLSLDEWGAILWAGMRGVILDCCARGDVKMAMDIVKDCQIEHIRTLNERADALLGS